MYQNEKANKVGAEEKMKNEKKVIVPTGYMGSGSSAITDLMSEIEDVDVSRGTFEYVFLHCPNGIFDLEDKLLIGNNAVRSDEALHSFSKTMKQLYDKKYWWVGHYNQNVGLRFWDTTQKYIDQLVEYKNDYYWYYQENVTARMIPKLIWNRMLRMITRGKMQRKKVLAYEPMWVSYITPERFYSITQNYIYDVLNMMGYDKGSMVLDQLLLPFNLFRMEKYFKKDMFVVVVERDPRDVFISNKYYWSKQNGVVPYPTDVRKFCEYYKSMRKMEKETKSSQVYRVKFEDLIYRYDETVDEIFKRLGWDKKTHARRKEMFNPERSIYNTQLFLKNDKYKAECAVIAEELKEYLYDFPYEIEHKGQDVF